MLSLLHLQPWNTNWLLCTLEAPFCCWWGRERERGTDRRTVRQSLWCTGREKKWWRRLRQPTLSDHCATATHQNMSDMSTRLQVDGVTHTENVDILNSVGRLWRGRHIPLEWALSSTFRDDGLTAGWLERTGRGRAGWATLALWYTPSTEGRTTCGGGSTMMKIHCFILVVIYLH